MQDYAVFLISDVFYVLISWSCSLDNSSSEKFFITPTIALEVLGLITNHLANNKHSQKTLAVQYSR